MSVGRRSADGRALALVAVGLAAVLGTATGCAPAAPPAAGTAASTSTSSAPAPVAPAEETVPPPPSPTLAPPPLTGRTVVLDPDHNRDNGVHPAEINRPVDAGGFSKACNTTGAATNDGVPEATINWELAVLLRDRLQALGAAVLLTRDADAGWGPCIDQRAAVANEADADLLLSLHADGAAAGSRGFHVITPGSRPDWTDDIEADSARAATSVRDALVAAGLQPSNYLGHDGIDVRTDLGTLNRSDVPAGMLEAGNLRNAEDDALLTSDAGRTLVTDGLTAAVLAFLGG